MDTKIRNFLINFMNTKPDTRIYQLLEETLKEVHTKNGEVRGVLQTASRKLGFSNYRIAHAMIRDYIHRKSKYANYKKIFGNQIVTSNEFLDSIYYHICAEKL